MKRLLTTLLFATFALTGCHQPYYATSYDTYYYHHHHHVPSVIVVHHYHYNGYRPHSLSVTKSYRSYGRRR